MGLHLDWQEELLDSWLSILCHSGEADEGVNDLAGICSDLSAEVGGSYEIEDEMEAKGCFLKSLLMKTWVAMFSFWL